MEYIEVSAKTVNDAITEACQKFGVTSDKLDYQVVEEGSNGFLGIGSKPAIIKAAVKCSVEDNAKTFLNDVFGAMNMTVVVDVKYNEDDRTMDIDLSGDEMGILIGKRGQTLDSLQYLVSLVVNKDSDNYIRVKVDTENYRQRRKETLENLARNIAYKVKRTKRPASLEPMNPSERRIIHSAFFVVRFTEHAFHGGRNENRYNHCNRNGFIRFRNRNDKNQRRESHSDREQSIFHQKWETHFK